MTNIRYGTRFGQDFEVEVQARLLSWSLVSISPLMFCRDYVEFWSWFWTYIWSILWSYKFSRDTDVWLRFWSWCLVVILKMKFDQDLWKNLRPKEVTLVSRTQPSGSLCLWQCFSWVPPWDPLSCWHWVSKGFKGWTRVQELAHWGLPYYLKSQLLLEILWRHDIGHFWQFSLLLSLTSTICRIYEYLYVTSLEVN